MSEIYVRLVAHNRHGEGLAELHQAWGVSFSTAKSRGGTLTFNMSGSDFKCNETNLAYGNLVAAYVTGLEQWWGIVADITWVGSSVLVTCNHILQRFGRRRTRPTKLEGATAGAIFRHYMGISNTEDSTGIGIGEVYEGGDTYTVELQYENVYEKLLDLVAMSKCEFKLETIRPGVWELHFLEGIGTDLTDKVVLYRGIDFDGKPELRGDNSKFANRIFAIGQRDPENNEEGSSDEERPVGEWVDWTSIQADGLSEDTIEVQDVSDVHTLTSLAQKEGENRLKAYYTLSLNLNNRRNLWGEFTDGDIICCYLPGYLFKGAVVPVQVLGREVNISSGVMTIAGEVVRGEKAQLLSMYRSSRYGASAIGVLPDLLDDEKE